MARKPIPQGVDLDEVERSDGHIVSIGRGSVPPAEPTVAEEVKAFLQQEDENDRFYEHRASTPPLRPPTTNLGEVARRALAASDGVDRSGGF
jgi:hypothetical protein